MKNLDEMKERWKFHESFFWGKIRRKLLKTHISDYHSFPLIKFFILDETF